MDRALDRLYRLCGLIAALLLIALTGLVLASIGARQIDVYIGGLTEFAGYTMAACSFFAMSFTFRSGGHIRVLLMVNRLHGTARRIGDLWCLGVFAVIICYLAYYLCQLAYDAWEFGEISEGGDAVALWIPRTPTAIGAAIFAICTVHTFIRAIHKPETLAEIDRGEKTEV